MLDAGAVAAAGGGEDRVGGRPGGSGRYAVVRCRVAIATNRVFALAPRPCDRALDVRRAPFGH